MNNDINKQNNTNTELVIVYQLCQCPLGGNPVIIYSHPPASISANQSFINLNPVLLMGLTKFEQWPEYSSNQQCLFVLVLTLIILYICICVPHMLNSEK